MTLYLATLLCDISGSLAASMNANEHRCAAKLSPNGMENSQTARLARSESGRCLHPQPGAVITN